MGKIPSSFSYVFLNYAAYILMFANSLLIGKYAGVKMFGIYGFILLVNQYLYYLSLGIPYSLGTIAITRKNKSCLIRLVFGNAIIISGVSCLFFFVILLFTKSLFLSLLLKYSINDLFPFIIGGALITNINNLMMQLFRAYSLYTPINFNQILSPLFIFILICLKGAYLAPVEIVMAFVLAPLLSLFCFVYNVPIWPSFIVCKKLIKILMYRGGMLLIYNMSFAFILTSASTIVSLYFAVDDFAQFKFAQNISSASVMITSAFTFLVYPKILNKLSNSKKPILEIDRYRDIYLGSFNFVSFLFVALIPSVPFFFEQFIPMIPILIILLVSKIFTNQAGLYSILYIARKKEDYLCVFSFLSVISVVLASLLFIYFGLPCVFVAFSVLIGSAIYYFLIIWGINLLDKSLSLKNVFLHDFDLSLVVPIILLFLLIILNEFLLSPLLVLLCFIALNIKKILKILEFSLSLQKHEKSFDF